ncbi:uncharacterized protein [Parasteatoda tepidariorum]|uniref:uncharacterized protein n=1 Tax=Parasteatoda tepidariorum TaxID=114398 RepID=UPI0039BD8AB5
MAKIISWNCRSYNTNKPDVIDIINKFSPCCICLQETSLKPILRTKLHGYYVIRKDNIGNSKASGGVMIMTSCMYPSSMVSLNTSLQAVFVRLSIQYLLTVCCIYLPPRDDVSEADLDELIAQLPQPFIIIDFNGHNPIWGSSDTNSRGILIEKLINNHLLSLLNSGENTYFHAPSQSYHAIDLAICSSSQYPYWSFLVHDNLFDSDHFPLILTHTGSSNFQSSRTPRLKMSTMNWNKFKFTVTITENLINQTNINDAVEHVTSNILEAAKHCTKMTSTKLPKHPKPWWNQNCHQAQKEQKKQWLIFRRHPTTDNLIAFKKARSIARRAQRNAQKVSWKNYVSSINSNTPSIEIWKKIKTISGKYCEHIIPILKVNNTHISHIPDIANALAAAFSEISSASNYKEPFATFKRNMERTKLTPKDDIDCNYNQPFTINELKYVLKNTALQHLDQMKFIIQCYKTCRIEL